MWFFRVLGFCLWVLLVVPGVGNATTTATAKMTAGNAAASDAVALCAFFNALTPNSKAKLQPSWCTGTNAVDPCNGGMLQTWKGVFCDKSRVSSVVLSNLALQGTLPTQFGLLDALVSLNLSTNSLYGTLPSELGRLVSLTAFSLKSNKFVGTIPTTIDNLQALTFLDLSDNDLTSLPTELGLLTRLTYLGLEGNNFTANTDIPTSFCNFDRAISLKIYANQVEKLMPIKFANVVTQDLGLGNCIVFNSSALKRSSRCTNSLSLKFCSTDICCVDQYCNPPFPFVCGSFAEPTPSPTSSPTIPKLSPTRRPTARRTPQPTTAVPPALSSFQPTPQPTPLPLLSPRSTSPTTQLKPTSANGTHILTPTPKPSADADAEKGKGDSDSSFSNGINVSIPGVSLKSSAAIVISIVICFVLGVVVYLARYTGCLKNCKKQTAYDKWIEWQNGGGGVSAKSQKNSLAQPVTTTELEMEIRPSSASLSAHYSSSSNHSNFLDSIPVPEQNSTKALRRQSNFSSFNPLVVPTSTKAAQDALSLAPPPPPPRLTPGI